MTSEPSNGEPTDLVRLFLLGREVACKAIIFDKDGTLVDPTGLQTRLTRMRALRAAAQATRGRLQASAGSCQAVKGTPVCEPAAQACSAPAVWEPMGAEPEDYPTGPGLLPGVADMLAMLRTRGLRMVVATGDRRRRAEATLDALGVRKHFVAVIGIDDVVHGKPAPDMVHVACERLGCSPAEVIVVGDSPADLMMGRAAGVAGCIGVTGGFTASSRLGALADVVLPTVNELADLFLAPQR